MTNPARELHEILQRWESSEKPTLLVRRSGTGDWAAGVRATLPAAEALAATFALADERTDHDYLSKSTRDQLSLAVFAPYQSWAEQGSGQKAEVPTAALEALATFAHILEITPSPARPLTDAVAEHLQARASSLHEEVLADKEIPDDLRKYLSGLLHHFGRQVADYRNFGDVDLTAAAQALIAELYVKYATEPDEARKSKLQWVLDNVIGWVAVESASWVLGRGLDTALAIAAAGSQ